MHWRIATVLLASVSIGTASAGQAATVTGVGGDLLINQGNGFRPVAGMAIVGAGSIVMVAGGGSAQIAYGDGCIVNVAAGRVEMIADRSPCSSTQKTNPITTGAVPAVEAAAASSLSTFSMAGMVGMAGIGGLAAVRAAQRQAAAQREAAQHHPSSP